MDKFNNKYRIPSSRLKNWDYASAGAYFITICTKNRKHFFGECINGKMQISTIGLIVQGIWYDIPNHTSANIILDEFIVMPNHIHGILILGEPKNINVTVETLHATSSEKADNIKLTSDISFNQTLIDSSEQTLHDSSDPLINSSEQMLHDSSDPLINSSEYSSEQTLHATSLRNDFFRQISPKPHSISRILGSFKSACTKHINLAFPKENFDWQERFWDNIIMNASSFDRICNYIINNPKTWEEDKFFDQCN